MSDREVRYVYSPVSDQWYLVTDWVVHIGGYIQATKKVPVTQDEVPEQWQNAMNSLWFI